MFVACTCKQAKLTQCVEPVSRRTRIVLKTCLVLPSVSVKLQAQGSPELSPSGRAAVNTPARTAQMPTVPRGDVFSRLAKTFMSPCTVRARWIFRKGFRVKWLRKKGSRTLRPNWPFLRENPRFRRDLHRSSLPAAPPRSQRRP